MLKLQANYKSKTAQGIDVIVQDVSFSLLIGRVEILPGKSQTERRLICCRFLSSKINYHKKYIFCCCYLFCSLVKFKSLMIVFMVTIFINTNPYWGNRNHQELNADSAPVMNLRKCSKATLKLEKKSFEQVWESGCRNFWSREGFLSALQKELLCGAETESGFCSCLKCVRVADFNIWLPEFVRYQTLAEKSLPVAPRWGLFSFVWSVCRCHFRPPEVTAFPVLANPAGTSCKNTNNKTPQFLQGFWRLQHSLCCEYKATFMTQNIKNILVADYPKTWGFSLLLSGEGKKQKKEDLWHSDMKEKFLLHADKQMVCEWSEWRTETGDGGQAELRLRLQYWSFSHNKTETLWSCWYV